MHVRTMCSPDKKLVSALWVIIVHIIIIIITIVINIIAASLGCHRCWGGLREARPSFCVEGKGERGKWRELAGGVCAVEEGERGTGEEERGWGEEEEEDGEGGEGE